MAVRDSHLIYADTLVDFAQVDRRRVPGQLQRARALPATHSLGRAGGPRRERAADHRGGPYAWPRGRAAGARLQAPPELGVISSLSLSLERRRRRKLAAAHTSQSNGNQYHTRCCFAA